MSEPLLSEVSRPGRPGHQLPACDVPDAPLPEAVLRDELRLPELGELEVIRHFTHLSQCNVSIDTTFYPLGSCTMKYNPRINEDVARLPGFALLHPYQPEETVQGALRLMYELQRALAEITGFSATCLQPAAGAHGELAGMLMIRAYHQRRGQGHRTKVLIPSSAHGTNPATAAMCGYYTVAVPTDARGNVDPERLRAELDEHTAALMITNPSTLGLFEEHIQEIVQAVHEAGALVYGDGANLNAILGMVKPGALGFDALHINVHKTFSTPHGAGGPGAGPVVVGPTLEPFLPRPIVARDAQGHYTLDGGGPDSIGRLRAFYGHFGIFVRAYTYLRMHGADGLRRISEAAVLNANYLRSLLQGVYELPYPRTCMHEFVLSGRRQKVLGVKTLDIAKRLIDYGFHPPTIYFPLIVEEAIMAEPTETESKDTLDAFAQALLAIAREAEANPDLARSAPHTAPVRRLDEVTAARKPILRWDSGRK
ncbi:MAG: aminomethyl-transferring glycine dehydrogenase subunit GcvPB [Chloroflexi bacterium]|nr:aminomethyl-transferring glycine dehydrogenase subunit GcvPB [Chloroflexota bacterium]